MVDVSRWLAEQGLGHHAEAFAKNGIAGGIVRELTDADLKELGLNLGDRKRLLKAIAALDAAPRQDRAEAAEPTTPAVPREAERRQLTVMFVDLVGSTELAARLDPEDLGALIRAYRACCAEVVKCWAGHVAKFMGDGVLVYFGWPAAHEDDAERAVLAGLELTKAVAGLQTGREVQLAARVGIATGLVMVGELTGSGEAQERSVIGETPNLAARLQALAPPHGVVISPGTRRLIDRLFELSEFGQYALKGLPEPVRAWQVLGQSRIEDRFEAREAAGLTPLVGREEELTLLLRRWEQAKDGEGQVVLLSGEAGIGKSRLIRAARERLGPDEPHMLLRHFCSPFQQTRALHPMIGLLERAAGYAHDDPPDRKLEKLEALLSRAAGNVAGVAPLIAALLAIPAGDRYPAIELSPQQQKERTFQALVDQLAGLATRQPVLAVYEDMQWSDPTTLELLEKVFERVQRLPVLVLITFRPEFTPPWRGQTQITSLALNRLSRKQGAAMVAEVTGGRELPAAVVEEIVSKTDGVPLFVEELTKAVVESGLLEDECGRSTLTSPLQPLPRPTTLHDSLLARLHRLAPAKEVAQIGAGIGREFSYELLAAVAPLGGDELRDGLSRLVEAELIFRQGRLPQATYSFKHALEPAPIPAGSRRAERRQLTVLFCDLVGSTELSARLDPEDLREVIGAYQAACARVIARFDGHVAKFLGDGVLAYFGWPRAHEDDAERAVRAGLAMVESSDGLAVGAEVPLAARIGIATGRVVVGDLEIQDVSDKDAVVGETPNLAARLQALAEPRSVVISQATRRLIGGLFELDDLGPKRLKGFAEPLAVWRVSGERRSDGRFEARQTAGLTPLVGREEEIARLLRRWRQARAGEGQVVLLSGEPGIGKSRLVRELRARFGDEPHLRLYYQCSPYHQSSPLYPLTDQLERAAGFERDDPPEVKLARLEALLARGTNKNEDAVPLIAALLGITIEERYPAFELTPQRQKQLTLEALLDQLEGLAAEQPVLAVHEDVHWIDPTTQELLGLAIERIPKLPVLLLITFRPDFSPPWSAQPHVSSLALTRLGRQDGALMVSRLVGAKALPAEVSAQIVAKTDGVPLFVEELTKMVLESGLLTDSGDHYELKGPLPPLAIPATLHDSLMARLDRLAPVREIAQLGAVIGHEFSQELLAAVADRPEDQLCSALDQLIASELVFRRGVPPDAVYTFKHTLVQDVAYQSLLKSRREQLHARIARVLEEQFPETAATEPERLAQHYTAAGLHDQAVDYWHQAGQRASERSADEEAIAHLTRGLELARALPDPTQSVRQELKILVALGEPLVAARGFGAPEVGVTYSRALELCKRGGNPRHLFPTMWGLWHFYRGRGALQTARDLGNDIMGLAERHGDPMLLMAAHQALGHSLYHMGQLSASLIHLEQARMGVAPKLDPSPHFRYGVAPHVQCLASLAQVLWCLGYPDQGLQRGREAVRSARELSHLHSLTCSIYFAIRLHLLRGETREADELAEAALALSTKQGFTFWTALIAFMQGWSLFQQGREAEGIARMHTGFADAEATGAKMMRPMFCALLTEAYGQVGQLDDAWRMLASALHAVEESGQRHYEAETYRFKGELHLRIADPEQAGVCFQRALDVARHQQAKSWELRAAVSLARLWTEQGKRAQAHDLLAPVYGWFTEGFDTADLKEARALLDELT